MVGAESIGPVGTIRQPGTSELDGLHAAGYRGGCQTDYSRLLPFARIQDLTSWVDQIAPAERRAWGFGKSDSEAII
jgi:hypothetical protein